MRGGASPVTTQNEIYVPAFVKDGEITIPEFWMQTDVQYWREKGYVLTGAEYQDYGPPTLAELRHAFFDINTDGSFVSNDYRRSVFSRRGYGEWTSTFLQDGKKAIERPEVLKYDKGRALWVAEGKITPVELPPNGWVLEYDMPTGFPSRTSQNRKDAERAFSNDTSYFFKSDSGLKPVLLVSGFSNYGPFYVCAGYEPDHRDVSYGVRPCRREAKDEEAAEPTHVYVMNPREYDTLSRLSQELKELLPKIRVQR